MRIFILSLLAVGSVQSYAIGSTGSQYRTGLWSYSPARGEFPVQSSVAKGYLRYIDDLGKQHLESYWYPEPLHGVRQHVAADSKHPPQFLRLESAAVAQAREEYFRVWCEQRLRDIQAEVDRLRASGVNPPQDIVEQLKPLQKILSASTDLTQRAKDEHLNLWNEARLRAIYAEHAKPLVVPSFASRTSAEDKPQLTDVKLVRAEKIEKANSVIRTEPQATFDLAQVKLSPIAVVVDTPEVIKAREEHFRLFHEAKMRAEKAGNEDAEKMTTTALPIVQSYRADQKITASQETPANVKSAVPSTIQQYPLGIPFNQLTVAGIRSVAGFDAPTEQQLRAVQETPEVQLAREEHLKLKKVQEEAIAKQTQAEKTEHTVKSAVVPAIRAQVSTNLKQTPVENTQPPSSKSVSQDSAIHSVNNVRTNTENEQVVVINQLGQVEETPEVKRAREEHLRLYEEAKLRATQTQTVDAVKPEDMKPVVIVERTDVMEEQAQYVEAENKEEARLEAERIREEERVREEQRLRDAKLLEEEQQNMEAELLKLRQEEEKRKEAERFAEEQRLKQEELILKAAEKAEVVQRQNEETSEIIGEIQADIRHTPASQSGFAYNPYLVHFAHPAGTNYLLAEQHPITKQSATVRYYFPASQSSSKVVFKQTNPFLQNYVLESAKIHAPQPQAVIDERQVTGVKVVALNNESQSVQTSEQALSELEKATREHFRAHEIALEQLRLAKLRNSENKDC